MEERSVVYRGQIYFVDLGDNSDCVQRGKRPAIVVSNNVGNAHSPLVTVVPITSKDKPDLPTHFKVWSGKIAGTALCEQVTTISKDGLGSCAGCLSKYQLESLNKALIATLDLSGQYNNGAPPIEEIVVQQQIEKCKKMQEELEKERFVLSKLTGETQEEVLDAPKVVRGTYRKRSVEERASFISEWAKCSDLQQKEIVAKKFGFNSVGSAGTFYYRYKEN